MNKTISVIVPIYNKEKFLPQCLESLVNQEYSDLEIILVDDGSTDKCGVICDELKKRIKNIVVIHKDNQGLPLAKTSGAQVANGDYISFVDADDYVDSDFFAKLVTSIDDIRPDIVVGGYVIDREGVNEEVFQARKQKLMNKDEAILCMFERRGFDWSGCGKLYKRDLFLMLEPWWYKSSYGEDTEINWKMFRTVHNVLYVPTYGYHYRIHNESLMRTLSRTALVYFDRTARILNEIEEYTDDCRIRYVFNEMIMQQAEWELSEFEEHGRLTDEIRNRLLEVIQECRKDERILYPYKRELLAFCESHDGLYIYGIGHYGKKAFRYLELYGIPLKGFLVTDGHKTVDFFHNVPVLELSECNIQCKEGVLIAVKDNKSIIFNLLVKGVQSDQIINWYYV